MSRSLEHVRGWGHQISKCVGTAHPQFTVPSFPLRHVQILAADSRSSDFWELAHKLGNSVQQYADDLLHDATTSNTAAAERLHEFLEGLFIYIRDVFGRLGTPSYTSSSTMSMAIWDISILKIALTCQVKENELLINHTVCKITCSQ